MMIPNPIRSIITVKKLTATRERVVGIEARIYTPLEERVRYDHLASARQQVGAARTRPVFGEGRSSFGRRLFPRRPVPRDQLRLQPEGRATVRGPGAR